MDDVELRADCLLAVTGLFPDEISDRERQVAAVLPDAWGRRLKTWLGAKQAEFPYVEPKDMEKIFPKVAADLAPGEVEALLGPVLAEDPELGAAYHRNLQRARQYLVGVWPRVVIDSMAGPKVMPLSVDDRAEIFSVFQVLDDPDRILDELAAGTLTEAQAAAFRACFPALWQEANARLDQAMAEKMSRRATDEDGVATSDSGLGWEPGWAKETLIRTFRGLPPEVPFVPPPQPTKDVSKFEIDADAEKTQADVSSAPKGPAAPKK